MQNGLRTSTSCQKFNFKHLRKKIHAFWGLTLVFFMSPWRVLGKNRSFYKLPQPLHACPCMCIDFLENPSPCQQRSEEQERLVCVPKIHHGPFWERLCLEYEWQGKCWWEMLSCFMPWVIKQSSWYFLHDGISVVWTDRVSLQGKKAFYNSVSVLKARQTYQCMFCLNLYQPYWLTPEI